MTMRKIGLGLLILVLLATAFRVGQRIGSGDAGDADLAQQSTIAWTCSMHPHIQLPEFGQCPVCFMDLIPVTESSGEAPESATLELTSSAAALAEIETRPVRRAFAAAEVRLVGRVAYAESRYRKITSWVAGRLDTLFVATTGEMVEAGEPMVLLYSPELLSTQTELLSAAAAVKEAGGTDLMNGTAARTLRAVRDRLRQWGLTAAQVEAIELSGEPTHHVSILAPISGVVVAKDAIEGTYVATGADLYTLADLSRVWVELEAFESDLPFLRKGQSASFTLEALPGRTLTGEVVFIDPVLDRRTRTATVRLEADNHRGELKPGLFVKATIEAFLDAEGIPVLETDEAQAPLIVPATAPLQTGRRAVVYVREPGDVPRFTGREVVLGPRAGDHYLVVSGLAEGEWVVVAGNFKIDSALQIQARPSMMNPVAETATPAEVVSDRYAHPPAGPKPSEAFLSSIAPVVDAYLAFQLALSGDDLEAAKQAARALGSTVDAVIISESDDEAVAAWTTAAGHMTGSLTTYANAKDLATIRASFDPFTDAFWAVLSRFQETGDSHDDRTLRLFHCPMFGDGADWIQTATSAANPYFGASMLRCGSQTDSLSFVAGATR